jgi:Ca2+-transporting ATPase
MAVAAGLTRDEARRRLREIGPNALPSAKRPSLVRRLVGQFKSALIYLLLLALALDLLFFADGVRLVLAVYLALRVGLG